MELRWTDERGGVSIIAGGALLCLIGMTGFAVDLNRGYEQRMIGQRVADMAALAAATAYKASASEAILLPTATDLVTAHRMQVAHVAASLVSDMPSPGSKAVRVVLTSNVQTSFARIFGMTSYPVVVRATASLTSDTTPACIIGLAASGNAIETSGGASINAASCAVVGAGSVRNGGDAIRAKQIRSGSANIVNDFGTIAADSVQYGGTFVNPFWNNNVPPPDKRTRQSSVVSDPLANNLALSAARDLLGTARSAKAPGNPTTPPGGPNWTFNYSPSGTTKGFETSSGNFLVPAGTYKVRRLEVAGGVNLTIADGATLTVSDGIVLGGNSARFGRGTYKFNGGFDSGSNGTTFGDVDLHIGSGSVSFRGRNRIGNGPVSINAPLSIGGGSDLTMGAGEHRFAGITIGGGGWLLLGNGNMDVTGGIRVDGDSSLIGGAGDYTLWNPGGDAIWLSGSGRFFMGDGLFSANGHISTAGGSRLVFGRTANHLIKGNLSIAGSVLFGAGRYTVNGNFTNGTGGTLWPYQSPINNQRWGDLLEGVSAAGYDMVGVNVTFVLAGTVNLGGGAFTKLIAPTVDTSGGAFASVLIDSLTNSATNWGAGSNNTFSGAIHLPRSAVTMSGGNNTISAGQCFTLIALRVIASGGANAATACAGIAGSESGLGDVELIS